jgi:hypothetical protein
MPMSIYLRPIFHQNGLEILAVTNIQALVSFNPLDELTSMIALGKQKKDKSLSIFLFLLIGKSIP